MKALAEIRDLLSCDVHNCDGPMEAIGIHYGCASDLMSDVLAFSRPGAVLLTGLVNIQTIQTAFIAEISAVILVRGKRPSDDVLALARERKIPLLSTPYSLYEASGKLYGAGLVSTMGAVITGARAERT